MEIHITCSVTEYVILQCTTFATSETTGHERIKAESDAKWSGGAGLLLRTESALVDTAGAGLSAATGRVGEADMRELMGASEGQLPDSARDSSSPAVVSSSGCVGGGSGSISSA
eukprot:1496250-Pleurochrysis_carterae.AAC.1